MIYTEPQTKLNYEDYTILIIDDNPTNLGVLSDYLLDYGFDIMIAQDGQSGLDKTSHVQPDLILLDVMMPGIDGFETCLRLKANPITRHIPVIFMTALHSIEDKIKGFEVGAVDYVTKPLQHEEALARITTHLRLQNLTRELQQANQTLYELNATKDKLFSIVAHDLRGPFGPIKGFARLLYLDAKTAPRAHIEEMAESIHRSAKVVYNLLDNLLYWARMQRGRMAHNPINLELGKVVKQTTNLLAETAQGKDIHLHSIVEEGLIVEADEQMLDIVIRNLTSNALKFTPAGGEVTISVKPSNSTPTCVEISVSDTGLGISPEDMNKLFKLDTHYTTQGTDQEKGTGLGLIICQEMVQKNGGQIWVESELGQGTTVKFTVPLYGVNNNKSSADVVDG